MKILLIGSGAREQMIAKKLSESKHQPEIIVFGLSLNPGIEKLVHLYHIGNLLDNEAIINFARENKPDFAVIGPEAPIANGVVDELMKINVPSASPTRKMGQLESSKGFTRELLLKHHIEGNPRFQVFTNEEGLMAFAEDLEEIVVKADGLHGGKGVLVQGDHFETLEEGVEAAKKFIKSDGQVVIEEKLVGQEFSLMSFVDGEHVVDMPTIQDHKRAFKGDTGPNTGGMGAYSYPDRLPFLKSEDVQAAHDITVKVAKALQEELGDPFIGIMYGGFMITKNGVRLIEYNARFGDPEAMNALTLLETDLVDIFRAQIDGTLDQLDIKFKNLATVCKYVVPEGYPNDPVKGERIELGEIPDGVDYYLASIDQVGDDLLMLGSRAIAFVAAAEKTDQAEQLVEKAISNIKGAVFHRKDIGTKALIEKRIKMMEGLNDSITS